MCLWNLNRHKKNTPKFNDPVYAGLEAGNIQDFHRILPGYKPTPLISLPGLASKLNLKEIWVKDESHRFGLKAFKSLGASYAIYKFLIREKVINENDLFSIDCVPKEKYIFCTATDGNHGRAVAWTARILSQKTVIYMPKSTVASRIKNIESEGAEVIIVDGEYDDAVQVADEQARKNGWQVISDTAYDGYTEIPIDIMAGYLTMFNEITDQSSLHGKLDSGVDIVFLQGGVGSLAASSAWYYADKYGRKMPRLVVVEPIEAACLMESGKSPDGELSVFSGSFQTIMAGLNCGTPSLMAWPILRETIDLFMAINDDYSRRAMRRYFHPVDDDKRIISGESGAAGLAGLLALMQSDNLLNIRNDFCVGQNSRILIINTEGDTDPGNFIKVTT